MTQECEFTLPTCLQRKTGIENGSSAKLFTWNCGPKQEPERLGIPSGIPCSAQRPGGAARAQAAAELGAISHLPLSPGLRGSLAARVSLRSSHPNSQAWAAWNRDTQSQQRRGSATVWHLTSLLITASQKGSDNTEMVLRTFTNKTYKNTGDKWSFGIPEICPALFKLQLNCCWQYIHLIRNKI